MPNSSPSDAKIILVDAYSQIYRGFFAVRSLSDSKGRPTNAVFATAKFLLALDRDFPATHGAVVFDIGKPKFRLDIAPEYKAGRAPMPDELRVQLPFIEEWLMAAGWPVLRHEDWEADDIIAGIAAAFPELKVDIVSADKDLAQLVSSRVRLLAPAGAGGGGGVVVRGVAAVREKFGVDPGQIVDYLSLVGDTSDNIPGVVGVGPKTAAALIAQFGSIDTMLNRLDEVANIKLRDKLGAAVDILRLNQRLVTLRSELPIPEWREIRVITRRPSDPGALKKLAAELELRSLIGEIDKAYGAAAHDNGQASHGMGETYAEDLFGG